MNTKTTDLIKDISLKIDKKRIQEIDNGGDIFLGSDGVICRDTKYILIELDELDKILPNYKNLLKDKEREETERRVVNDYTTALFVLIRPKKR